jgi:predicted nucleic acid-binding protein
MQAGIPARTMSAKRPISTIDAPLAATARTHGMTLATRNIADVGDIGADVLNPFEPRTKSLDVNQPHRG